MRRLAGNITGLMERVSKYESEWSDYVIRNKELILRQDCYDEDLLMRLKLTWPKDMAFNPSKMREGVESIIEQAVDSRWPK